MLKLKLSILATCFFLSSTPLLYAENETSIKALGEKSEFSMQVGNVPTYIKSDKLSLKSAEQIFTYSGNVNIIHGDLRISCGELEGHYSDNNEIETMIAQKNVVILKGNTIRGVCQKAVYSKKTGTIVLSENPELQQNGSVLSADAITLNLETNKSDAQGNVRVKLIKQSDKKE